ncbi:DHHC palmitoyltransferase-domain-containing protein [Choanephora cucurbitarum]|nr:DHHC palmitoyltransferase-domain-containing protein [Choanephora cucurbitarum]
MSRSLTIGIIMPLLVFSILTYTFYHYLQFKILMSENSEWNYKQKTGTTVFAAYCYAMSLVSYAVIMIKPQDSLSLLHKPLKEEEPWLTLSNQEGDPLYCERCKIVKPERTHHCRECNQCTAKMDHHCIWINGCVDQSNYKQFFLFVFYVALYSLHVEFTLLPYLLKLITTKMPNGKLTLGFAFKIYKIYLSSIYHFWRNALLILQQQKWITLFTGVQGLGLEEVSLHWYIVCFLGFVFGVTVSGFALAHFCFIIKNKTSIEYAASRPIFVKVNPDPSKKESTVVALTDKKEFKDMYDIGCYRNWCSVMGANPFLWLLPFKESPTTNLFPHNPDFITRVMKKIENKTQTNKNV